MQRSAPGSITTEDERRPRRLRSPEPAKPLERVKLLLVDDTPANLIALASILDAPQYELVSCDSGAEALRLLRTNEFAVVLADVMMPEMDGYELASRVPEHDGGRATPVILLTAMATDSRHVHRGLAAGAVDYLQKPLEPEFVKAKVAVFVELHRQRHKVRQQEARLAELERREQERLLAEAERVGAERGKEIEKLAALVENTSDLIALCAPDAEVLYVNPAGLAMIGLTSAEARELSLTDLFDDGARGFAREVVIPRVLADGSWQGEVAYRHLRSGASVPVHLNAFLIRDPASNAPVALACCSRDLRALRRAEEETRRSHVRYRTLVDATTSIVWSQSPIGEFIEPQPSWEAYTGQRWDDYKAKGWLNALPLEDRAPLLASWADARLRAERFEVEGRLWHEKTRAYRWFLARGAPILDAEGHVVEWIGTFNDVDDRLRAVEEIRKLNETLERRVAERTAELRAANRELESFSYSVSHDLRAPLRGIDGFSEILLREHAPTLDEPARVHLTKIRAAASRMAQLIDDMLSLSRVTRREMRRDDVRLSDLVRQIADELKAREPARDVTFVIEPELVCTGDPVLLRAAMENLVGNAWKFTSRHATARIEFGCRDENAQRVFFLKDDGAGFKMAYAGKLFGAFQRLHGTHEFPGTGIGLATVQRIIQRHGGRIWAEGQVEQGATFSFVLGRAKEAP